MSNGTTFSATCPARWSGSTWIAQSNNMSEERDITLTVVSERGLGTGAVSTGATTVKKKRTADAMERCIFSRIFAK
ncbi:hypothetical protein FRB91_002300 [Serendipita sp. 411]|nr:hypothetical protein FRB91_002300 [Serendipita sp. 411]